MTTDGQRDLADHQQAGSAETARRAKDIGLVQFERVLAGPDARRFHAGAKPARIPVSSETPAAKSNTSAMQGDVCEPRSIRRQGKFERLQADCREDHTRDAGKGGDKTALGQHLPHQAPGIGAERATQRHLPLARGGAGEHQVGDVGAGDQQHQPDRSQQQKQLGTGISDNGLQHGRNGDTRGPVIGHNPRKERKHLGVKGAQFGLGEARLRLRLSGVRWRGIQRSPRDRECRRP